jgi:hypothetical protein
VRVVTHRKSPSNADENVQPTAMIERTYSVWLPIL